jgi:molybdenum cofactor cytidylyltransferase
MPDPVLIAIFAAGASRRLGTPKQFVCIDNQPLVRRQAQTAIDAAIGPVLVITGCHADKTAASVADLPVTVIHNNEWEEGLAASVRTASREAIACQAAGLMIVHCDQYALTAADLQTLHAAWRRTPAAACLSRADDHLGPPSILPAVSLPQLLKLAGDRGPRAILSGLVEVVDIPIPNARFDLDEPSQMPPTRTNA